MSPRKFLTEEVGVTLSGESVVRVAATGADMGIIASFAGFKEIEQDANFLIIRGVK